MSQLLLRGYVCLCFLVSGVFGAAYHIVQGFSRSKCLDSTDDKCTTRAVEENEHWNVRCCADTDPGGWVKNHGCSVYTNSFIEGCHNVNFATAVKICSNAGGRLCTREELEYPNDCSSRGGCDFDSQMVWSSTEGTVGLSEEKYYISKGQQNGGCLDTIDSTCATRAVSKDERWHVRCCADSNPGGWHHNSRCDIFVTSKVPHCVSTDWESAAELCSGIGGRLCSVEELGSNCAKWGGCGHDQRMVWSASEGTPNIVFILADDLGSNDLGFHGSEFNTPSIDALFTEGYQFTRFYTSPVCAPSRIAFMSGRYPFRFGLTAEVFPSTPAHLPVSATAWAALMPELYTNYYVGKWHLGYSSTTQIPTGRGFDDFFSFFNGMQDYHTHTTSFRVNGTRITAYDLWYDGPLVDELTAVNMLSAEELLELTGYESEELVHNSNLFTGRAMNIIDKVEEPFTLTFSPQDPHSPLVHAPDDRLDSEIYDCNLTNSTENRKIYCEQVSLLDDSVRQIVEALKNNRLWNNTYVIFAADNGGSVDSGRGPTMLKSAASNYPMRGGKGTFFEGGVNSVFAISGGALQPEYAGRINVDLHHAIDVPVTMVNWAGNSMTDVDGIDMFSSDTHDELFVNIQDARDSYAYIKHELKFLQGRSRVDGWWEFGYDELEATFNCEDGCVFNLTADKYETTNLINTTYGAEFYEEAMDKINSIVIDGEYLDEQENMWWQCAEAMTTATAGYWAPWDDKDIATCTLYSLTEPH